MRVSRTLPVVCSKWYCCFAAVLTTDMRGNPYSERSFPPVRLGPAVIDVREKQEGSVPFVTPPMQENEGFYISPLVAASTNHIAFYSFTITGFEGRKEKIYHYTSFADRIAFPACSVYCTAACSDSALKKAYNAVSIGCQLNNVIIYPLCLIHSQLNYIGRNSRSDVNVFIWQHA